MSATRGANGGTPAHSKWRIVAALGVTTLVAGIAVAVWLVSIESKQLAWQSLLNATYTTSITPRGAALRDGTFEAVAAPGSASKISVRLADIAAFGDLDGNLAPDAAVVLVSSGGGSGTFVELAAVRNERGAAHPVATVLLGDRILVREVRIETRRILVRLRARGATDPFSLRTREISRHYALDGNSLVLLDESEAEVQSTPAEDYVYRPERLDVAVGSHRSERLRQRGLVGLRPHRWDDAREPTRVRDSTLPRPPQRAGLFRQSSQPCGLPASVRAAGPTAGSGSDCGTDHTPDRCAAPVAHAVAAADTVGRGGSGRTT
ncbi:MAG: hypothetical protein E6I19_13865, partial [Chloroflexi bacterium]